MTGSGHQVKGQNQNVHTVPSLVYIIEKVVEMLCRVSMHVLHEISCCILM